MNRKEFTALVSEAWSLYYAWIRSMLGSGRMKLAPGARIAFPQILVVVETPTHFIYELVGLGLRPSKLEVRVGAAASTEAYFYQFPSSVAPRLTISGGAGVGGATLGHDEDIAQFQSRFPGFSRKPGPFVYTEKHDGPWLGFGDGCGFIENCELLNRRDGVFRLKHVVHAGVVSRGEEATSFRTALERFLRGHPKRQILQGVLAYRSERERLVLLAGQFASTYLTPKLPEIEIGKFIERNPDSLRKSLGYEALISEPHLPWVDGKGAGVDDAINPDLFLQDAAGCWHIGDLKLPKLERQRLTQGGLRRRRFVDYVNEGAAQLANYREYFSTPRNAEHAFKKYGVSMSDPRLILIVGTVENLGEGEIEEASRMLDPRIDVVSYDMIAALLGSAISKA